MRVEGVLFVWRPRRGRAVELPRVLSPTARSQQETGPQQKRRAAKISIKKSQILSDDSPSDAVSLREFHKQGRESKFRPGYSNSRSVSAICVNRAFALANTLSGSNPSEWPFFPA